MSVVVGPVVARFVPPYALADAAKLFAEEGVTDIVLVRRDDYDETCRLAKVARAFIAALNAAYETPTTFVAASAPRGPNDQ